MSFQRSLAIGVLAAVGASVCCIGPLVLLLLGIGGAWVGSLKAFEPYRPVLLGVAAVFLVLAFRKLYLVPQACVPGAACVEPAVLTRQRLLFWLIAVPTICLLILPWVASLIL